METPQTAPPTAPAGAIVRPDEPRHFLVMTRVAGRAVARIGDTVLASSRNALSIEESFGQRHAAPVVYFPPEDVQAALLTPTDATSSCPLKGTAAAYDVETSPRVEGGAWSYHETHDFDRRLTQLESCVAFDRERVTIEIRNDEE